MKSFPLFSPTLLFPLLLLLSTSWLSAQQYAIIASHSGLAFDVDHASQDDGAIIRQQENVKGENQRWEKIHVRGNTYRFRAAHSRKYLTAPQNGATEVIQSAESNGLDQEFLLIHSTGNTYNLLNIGTGKYLSVPDGRKDAGISIVLAEPNNEASQRFSLEEIGYVHYGYIRPAEPVYYSFTVTNKSMWDVSFRVKYADGWSDWKYANVSVNPKEVTARTGTGPILDYDIMWKDWSTWKDIPGGTPVISDNGSMSLVVSGNTLTGIKVD